MIYMCEGNFLIFLAQRYDDRSEIPLRKQSVKVPPIHNCHSRLYELSQRLFLRLAGGLARINLRTVGIYSWRGTEAVLIARGQ
jgi:hypothetical protein